MKTVEKINTEIMRLGILRQGDQIPVVLKEWAESILDEAADKAMLEEHIPEEEQDEYDAEIHVHSGGYIREEHLVKVNKESITKIKSQL